MRVPEQGATAFGEQMLPEKKTSSSPGRPDAAVCEHDFQLDPDLQGWVCSKCGKALMLVSQQQNHECGPDCDKHGDIAGIG
jgi:hypothetical protein